MTTAIAPDARRSVGLFSTGLLVADHKPKFSWAKGTKTEALVLNVTDVPVFRSGEFRDSMGYQHTWEDMHISQMVNNHDFLKAQGIFSDIPVRKGHGSFLGDPMDSLVGWHTGVRAEKMTSTHDGKEYTYLLASYEIFDEEAQKRVEGGHWRNRSSEVGFYLTNAEAEYWPVYQGFAFVDIPAVEGLNGFTKAIKSRKNFSMMMEEELSMTDEEKAAADKAAADQAAAEKVAADKAAADAAAAAAVPPPVVAPPAQEAPAVPVVAPVAPVEAAHSAATGTQSFKVNGQPVADFAAVQAHIDVLETANVEREKETRGSFVKGLATSGKIAATQLDALTLHAQGLSPESYASWSASYDAVPASGLFGQYGVSGGEGNPVATPGASVGGETADQQEISRLEGVVALHGRTMTAEQVKNTPSFKKLEQLKSAQVQS